MRKRCQACGHAGGALELRRSAVVDELARRTSAPVLVPGLLLCAGELFADDGATACLRRQAQR